MLQGVVRLLNFHRIQWIFWLCTSCAQENWQEKWHIVLRCCKTRDLEKVPFEHSDLDKKKNLFLNQMSGSLEENLARSQENIFWL